MIQRALPFITLVIFIFCMSLLMTGSEILTKPVIDGLDLPWGTIITWVGLISLPAVFVTGIKNLRKPVTASERMISKGYKVIAALAIAWGLISYLLSGNWGFTFSSRTDFRGSIKASEIFWTYTTLIVIMPFLLYIIYLGISIIKRLRRDS